MKEIIIFLHNLFPAELHTRELRIDLEKLKAMPVHNRP